jgi:tetratricopeptide (TPR) repeat protein
MRETWDVARPPAPDDWEQAVRRRVVLGDVIDTAQEPLDLQRMRFYREGIVTTVSTAEMICESFGDLACWLRFSLKVNGKADASLSVRYARPPSTRCREVAETVRRGDPAAGEFEISPSGDAETQILSGLLPVLLHPGTPRRALVVGWGSGMTVGATLQSGLERIEAVELERAVIDGAAVFRPYNHDADRDPRVAVIDNDGRNYLEMMGEQVDIIISEPSNPWITGASNLFTREFFRTVRARLAPQGRYLQWLQIYEISPDNVRSILGTIHQTFPEVLVFQPQHSRADLLIVAGDGIALDWQRLERRFAEPAVRAELARLDIRAPEDIVARLLLPTPAVHAWTRGYVENTDDNARVEYRAPLDLINYRRYSYDAIGRELWSRRGDALAATRGAPDGAALRLAHAYLRVGRPEDAEAVAQGQAGAGWDEVRGLAALLREDRPAFDLAPIMPADPRLWTLKTALAGTTEEVTHNLTTVRGQLDPTRDAALGFALHGELKRQADDPPSAAAYWTAALRAEPAPPLRRMVLVQLGKLYQSVGRYDRAFEAIRAALALPAPPASGPASAPESASAPAIPGAGQAAP